MNPIVQIVPTLPPVVDGLGDFAVLLDGALAAHGVNSRFLVTTRTWSRAESSPLAEVLHEPSAAALVQALSGHQQVLLHFVNYAYDPTRGCPQWMLDGLHQWRKADGGRRLVVMFHELYAMGWPWRKAFWYSATQRALSAALARLADACWTSNHRYAAWLRDVRGHDVPVFPVLSNLGEPAVTTDWSAREPALVVFGRAVNRHRAYRTMRDDLIALARTHGLSMVHDVGAPLSRRVVLPGMTMVEHGLLPAEQLSSLLQRCRVGVIHNDGSPLAKSGVVAAYAAHGVAICSEAGQPAADGLVPGYNLMTTGDITIAPAAVAARGRHWYERHDRQHLGGHIAPWFATQGI